MELNNIRDTHSDTNKVIPVKFLIRQMNGILRGECTLDDKTSKLYRTGTHKDRLNIRLELNVSASEHFKTDCCVCEILNRQECK